MCQLWRSNYFQFADGTDPQPICQVHSIHYSRCIWVDHLCERVRTEEYNKTCTTKGNRSHALGPPHSKRADFDPRFISTACHLTPSHLNSPAVGRSRTSTSRKRILPRGWEGPRTGKKKTLLTFSSHRHSFFCCL